MSDIDGMRIRCAAILLEDGRVFEGAAHHEALANAHAVEADRVMVNRAEQGFMTECGRFVRRKPALRIALQADQVKEPDKVRWHFGLDSSELKKEGD